MTAFTILIDDINTHNDDYINDITGIAGYSGMFERIDLCSGKLDLSYNDVVFDEESRKKIREMIGAFVMRGFKVTWIE